MAPTGRSAGARKSRMSRRRGSATALKLSEVVAARDMRQLYTDMGICQGRVGLELPRSCYLCGSLPRVMVTDLRPWLTQDIPSRPSLTIPLTVTSKQGWFRPQNCY